MSSILIVASHLDDIEIAMGGTALKLCAHNDVYSVIMTDGNPPTRPAHEQRISAFEENIKTMGIKRNYYLNYRDQYLFSYDLNEYVEKLQNIIDETKPECVYTQNADDVNIDHRITSEAVRVCTRPRITSCVDTLYEFSVPGSTEWNNKYFNYNTVVDITQQWPVKMSMISNFQTEIRPEPDPCSLGTIKSRDEYHGGLFGYDKAEVFKLIFDRRS